MWISAHLCTGTTLIPWDHWIKLKQSNINMRGTISMSANQQRNCNRAATLWIFRKLHYTIFNSTWTLMNCTATQGSTANSVLMVHSSLQETVLDCWIVAEDMQTGSLDPLNYVWWTYSCGDWWKNLNTIKITYCMMLEVCIIDICKSKVLGSLRKMSRILMLMVKIEIRKLRNNIILFIHVCN